MQYTKITLCKYKRLALNHIDVIDITPVNKIQLILGTNGSGKSSLLSQITPLPASHQDYFKDGYKVIELMHNNSHYVLKNIFTGVKNRYHFIKDGVELNDGLTASTYTELVKKEFKITPETQSVLVGNTLFSSMSVADRRTWLTRISNRDYTYAFQYYKKLKDKHRDMVGAVKLHQSRLVQESDKLLSPAMEDSYRKEIELLQELLDHYLSMKGPLKFDRQSLNRKLQDLDTSMLKCVDGIRTANRAFPNTEGYTSEDDIENDSIKLLARKSYLENEIQILCSKIEEHDSFLRELEDSNVSDAGNIHSQIDSLMNEISQLQRGSLLKINFNDPRHALEQLESVSHNLCSLMSEFVTNEDKRYSRDTYIQTSDKSKALHIQLTQIRSRLQTVEIRKQEQEHFKAHNEIQCPKCSHTWYKGFSEIIYQQTLTDERVLTQQVIKLTEEITSTDKYLVEIRDYLEKFRDYQNLTKAYAGLQSFWQYLLDTSVIFEAPGRVIGLLDTLRGDLGVQVELKKKSEQLKDTLELKKKLQQTRDNSVEQLMARAEVMHNTLHDLTTELQSVNSKAQRLVEYRSSLKTIQTLSSVLETHIAECSKISTDFIDLQRNEAFNSAIQLIHLELTDREQTIAKQDIQRAVIMDIELQVKDLTKKSELLKIGIDKLSPSEGLIAKGLTGFINHFLAQMNVFIKNVWLYPMELVPILPAEDDGIELDYKFQVRVNDDPDPDNLVPDISKGSAGMKEIIDLAFKVVSMLNAGLDKAPLVLDEFGTRLDSAHRQSAQFTINNIITSSNFSQVFMVSHYENCYGSLTNADVCVLHPSNINIPKDLAYNRHVTIT